MAGEVRLTFDQDGRPVYVPVYVPRQWEALRPLEDDDVDVGGMFELFEPLFGDEGEHGKIPTSAKIEMDLALVAVELGSRKFDCSQGSSPTVHHLLAPSMISAPVELCSRLAVETFPGKPEEKVELGSLLSPAIHQLIAGLPIVDEGRKDLSIAKGKAFFIADDVAPEKMKINDGRDSLLLARTWQPRTQVTAARPMTAACPVSVAPGAPLDDSTSARPVSMAPGAHSCPTMIRSVSDAPGIDGDGSTEEVVRTSNSLRTSRHEPSNISTADQSLTARSLIVFQKDDSVVAIPLVENVINAMAVTILGSRAAESDVVAQNCVVVHPGIRPEEMGTATVEMITRGERLSVPLDDLMLVSFTTGPVLSADHGHVNEHLGPSDLAQAPGMKNHNSSENNLDHGSPLSEAHMHNTCGDDLEDNESFYNSDHPPSKCKPLPNFKWVFLHGFWTLIPVKFSNEIPTYSALGTRRSERRKKPSSSGLTRQDLFLNRPDPQKRSLLARHLKTQMLRSLSWKNLCPRSVDAWNSCLPVPWSRRLRTRDPHPQARFRPLRADP